MSSEKDSDSVTGHGSIDSGASIASTGCGSIDSGASITSTSSLNVTTAYKEKVPVLLSGCNFIGCTITFSGLTTNIS